ncbi:MAG: GrpB family protein [Pseudomonadota bacterium]
MERPKARPVPHDPAWSGDYEVAKRELQSALGDVALAIHHVGSTAIPGILAKPVIDILVEATSLEAIDRRTGLMASKGFMAKGEKGIAGRRYFSKDDAHGVRTHHVHAFAQGSPHLRRHLAFRDYVLAHPRVAARYNGVKQAILSDWQGLEDYIARKSAFVEETERAALEWRRTGSVHGERGV